MKKLLIGIVTILLVCFGLEAGAKQLNNNGVSTNNKNLIIYNWGDYIDPKLIKKFEKQTGYHVIYETFDSNEAMYEDKTRWYCIRYLRPFRLHDFKNA